MSFNHNPSIVRNGLVLCLDAKDLKSYSGTGTTWVDRSGNGNNGTLVNGVSAVGGAMSFNGVNQYVDEINFSNIIPESFTINAWLKFINASSPLYQKVFHAQTSTPEINVDNYNGGSGNPKIHFYTAATSSTNNIMTTGEDIINNVWYFVSAVYENSSFQKSLYVNSVLKNSKSTGVKINWPNSLSRIGYRLNGTEPFNGNIGSFQIYNRALSQAEILQNFNAQKGRYGL